MKELCEETPERRKRINPATNPDTQGLQGFVLVFIGVFAILCLIGGFITLWCGMYMEGWVTIATSIVVILAGARTGLQIADKWQAAYQWKNRGKEG
jgi:hypothetical protein